MYIKFFDHQEKKKEKTKKEGGEEKFKNQKNHQHQS